MAYAEATGFAEERSLKAFEETAYQLTSACRDGCHGTMSTAASGAQAPIHADDAVADTLPQVPRGVDAGTRITDSQELACFSRLAAANLRKARVRTGSEQIRIF